MEKSPDVEHLFQIGNVEHLGKGIDSLVYKVSTEKSEFAVKEYQRFVARFGEGVVKDTLASYYADTERAQSLIENNSNPLNQKIPIEGKEFELNYIVVPQGGMLLEGEDLHYLNGDPSDKVPIVASQTVIPAKNLANLYEGTQEDGREDDGQKAFYGNAEFVDELEDKFDDLVDYLNRELKVEFTESMANVKPFLDEKHGKINVYITDLASSLADYFMSSPSMERARQKHSKVVDAVNNSKPKNKK
jgi:hypothetical protein